MSKLRKEYELAFGVSNAKLTRKIITFSLPSGFSCPSASECLAKANRETGKITDGTNQKYRCFAAQEEAFKPSMRASRWRNFDILREHPTTPMMAAKILGSLDMVSDVARVHVGGDYYSQPYFDAWLMVARMRPGMLFYSYTKSINFWVNRLKQIPDNFSLVASYGGKFDDLIKKHKLCSARVVYHPDAAKALALEIDHDDSHAMIADKSFALLLHGVQPKGTPMAAALKKLKEEKIKFSYSNA